MQIVTVALESDVDTISADLVSLVMQGLSDITQEMNEEFQSFGGVVGGESGVAYALGVVCNR